MGRDLKKKNLWPIFMDGNQLFQGYRANTTRQNLRRMKGWVDLGASQWFWTRDPWIGNPAPYTPGHCSPSLPTRNDLLVIAIKHYKNADIKAFYFLSILLGFQLYPTYFCYSCRTSIQQNILDSLMCIYLHEGFTDPN